MDLVTLTTIVCGTEPTHKLAEIRRIDPWITSAQCPMPGRNIHDSSFMCHGASRYEEGHNPVHGVTPQATGNCATL